LSFVAALDNVSRMPSKYTPAPRDAKDVTIPLVLIVLGFLGFAFAGYRALGPQGPAIVMAYVGVWTFIGTGLMVLAAYVTAGFLSVSFGELGPASLKLAAVYLFPAAVALVIPMGWIAALFLWLGLLMWLFELEMYQAVIFAIIFLLVRILMNVMLAQMFA